MLLSKWTPMNYTFKDVEIAGHDLILRYSPGHSLAEIEENSQKSVGIVGIPHEIRTGHLSNTCYRLSQLAQWYISFKFPRLAICVFTLVNPSPAFQQLFGLLLRSSCHLL
jgi:hypothetical protein